ncbi:MAG: hypothetical protein EP329_07840, partial [Deltaproteobacteria bacterium]
MRQLFGRYFWAVRLAGLAILALAVAHGVNEGVSSLLATSPARGDLAPGGTDGVGTNASHGRVAAEEPAAERLAARHVFGVPSTPAPPPPPGVPAPKNVRAPGEPLAETTLAIALVGTLVAEEPTSSVAALRVAGRPHL